MALGIYMDNLSDYEDNGEVIKKIIFDSYSPDFKNRSTIQNWIPITEDTKIKDWVGNTLAESSAHEIYIVNNTVGDIKINFHPKYFFTDEVDDDNNIYLKLGETAHFYSTGVMVSDGRLTMVLRTGSQDTRS